MTKPLPFTEQSIRRALAAVRKEGYAVKATTIHPDGAVTVYHEDLAPLPAPGQNAAAKEDQW